MATATAVPAARGHNVITGIAGEHFVAAELSKRGWIVALTGKNMPGVDLFASRPGTPALTIDVKTRTSASKYGWGPFSAIHPESDFVVLVDLGGVDEAPEYWVVPGPDARRLLTKGPGQRYGQLRNRDVDDDYFDAWGLLDGEKAR